MDRIAILVGTKGRGSNMLALIDGCLSGAIPATVGVVIAPSAESPALLLAKERGVKTTVVEAGEDLLPALANCDWICLAGLMRLLPTTVLDKFRGRVLNIHPALLPKFGGKGMYGMHVHRAVIAAGEEESGCTVHIVTEVYDEGPIVLQRRCPVLPDDTPESLAARVLALEHQTYPEALAKVIRG